MIKLFGLVILTQKEVIQLAKEERGLGYRAGLKSKWQAKKKPVLIPEVYGDSLPVREVPEVTVHIGDVGPIGTGIVTDNLHYT
jgi:hypothetical protein